jgi:hypothetical protein
MNIVFLLDYVCKRWNCYEVNGTSALEANAGGYSVCQQFLSETVVPL